VTIFTPEQAIDIIASHGADPARWPADARAALLALAGSDADVAAALADARALDADLATWLAAPAPALAVVDIAAITALPREGLPVRRRAPGWQPALLAASLALTLATAGWLAMPGAPGARSLLASSRSPSAVAEADETALVFAQVFTPTAAEEDLI
jgi:hypothetical protein